MAIRVAINGLGRIGRSALRAARATGAAIEVVAVNDLADGATMAHLLRYDSVLGPYPGTIQSTGRGIEVDGAEILVLAERDPRNLPWSDLGVDVVLESTGLFTDAGNEWGYSNRCVDLLQQVVATPAIAE